MRVVYEDNHIIIVYKESGEIVQGDKTGDTPLSEIVKSYIKEHEQGIIYSTCPLCNNTGLGIFIVTITN